MSTLATRYGISNVALAKACRRYNIPVPERGYWAKKKAGKGVQQRPLSIRSPGMSDTVTVGAEYGSANCAASDRELLETTPEPPVFEHSLDEVTAEVRAAIGKVSVPKVMNHPHRLIAKLLAADEARRKKVVESPFLLGWDDPLFDTPFERRRLRLLNAIFTALDRYGVKPWLSDKEARGLGINIHGQRVLFSLDDANVKESYDSYPYKRCANPSGKLKITIQSGSWTNKSKRAWEDAKGLPLEKVITDIVIELIVAGEKQYRDFAQSHY